MNEFDWLTCEDPYDMVQSPGSNFGFGVVTVDDDQKFLICTRPVGDVLASANEDISSKDACNLIREVVGNPFRPVVIPPCSWNTPDVFYFAVNIIESGDYVDVDVLADRLEEAGCDNEEILRHLRGEVRCAECGGDEIARRDGPIFCTVCCNSCWLPKPVPCQPGCWVLRLLTEPQPPPDQSVTFRAGEIEG